MKKAGRITFVSVIVFVIVLAGSVKADIVGLWRFEEDDANKAAHVVIDQSGKSNNGTVQTGWVGYDLPSYITSHDSSHAMLFGYDDVYGAGYAWNNVSVPKSSSLAYVGTTWTMASWVRCDSTVGSYEALHHYPKIMSCPNYEITLHSSTDADSNSYFWPWDETWMDWDFNMAPTGSYEGQWKHMAVTYDGTTFTQYIDGAVVFTKNDFTHQFDTTTWDTAYSTYPLKIASFSDSPNGDNGYLIGALDDVAIFNECLDAGQIAKIRDGNFAGPWQPSAVPEIDLGGGFLWDYTFIAQYNTIVLGFGQKRPGDANNVAYIPSWNWQMEGILSDRSYYGLVNAGLWDGNSISVEYAAYTTVGDIIAQPKDGDWGLHWKMHKDTKYNLKARLGGENAVGNIVGVRFYAVDPNNPNDKTLLADLSQTIATNETWYMLSTTFTAGVSDNNKEFRAECYIDQAGGNPRGTAFGYFDYIRIDVNEFLTCQALQDYGMGLPLPYDWVPDCRIDFADMTFLADDWGLGNNPEPMASATELLANNDFYADLNRAPNAGDFNGGAPTGWQFVPSTSDANLAGVWNVSNMGKVNSIEVGTIEPAGGSIAAYIDPNHEVRQAVSSPTIVNGQTYYLSAMLGGVSDSYYHALRIIYEYVDNPTSPTSVTEIATQEYVLPESTTWRRFYSVWAADSSAAGKYFRVRAAYVPPAPEIAEPNGWGLIGNVSIDTVKPAWWLRSNLITNGDFEDYSNLPMGTLGDQEGWINLFTYNGWTYFSGIPSEWPPGWTFQNASEDEGGLQCMLWAPSPQPAHGRISLWMGVGPVPPSYTVKIDQKVTSETIQTGQTYYLDYIGAISAEAFNNGSWTWPTPDPNLVVELYWLAAGINDIYGPQGSPPNYNWDLIMSLKQPADNGLGASGGHWQTAQTSFTADSSLNGKSFFVRAYSEGADYATFEEIYLSKEPPQVIGGYTCAEQTNKFGGMVTDLNGDCNIDIFDLGLFVDEWVNCNDPEGCP